MVYNTQKYQKFFQIPDAFVNEATNSATGEENKTRLEDRLYINFVCLDDICLCI